MLHFLYRVVSWLFIVIYVIVYAPLYFLLTTREDRLFHRRMEDITIASNGNPAAGAWLAAQYTKRMREERREKEERNARRGGLVG